MKEIRQAIVLVDNYRRPSRQRNTAGRYRVGAKTEKEAEELVQKAIGFGSVQFYYWEDKDNRSSFYDNSQIVPYKKVVKEVFKNGKFHFVEPSHACSRR